MPLNPADPTPNTKAAYLEVDESTSKPITQLNSKGLAVVSRVQLPMAPIGLNQLVDSGASSLG